MSNPQRRKTPTVRVGSVSLGSRHHVVIQSMTDTPTSDTTATFSQTRALINCGTEMVRWTVSSEKDARAVPKMIRKLQKEGYTTPIIGDFHYIGHRLLKDHPDMAKSLSKYRINPGNVGTRQYHDKNFAAFIGIAQKYDKPVRIGVNSGSLDQDLLKALLARNAKKKRPTDVRKILVQAAVESALRSAEMAHKLGLKNNRIVLSVKMSGVQECLAAYTELSQRTDCVLHLGLTEAGSGLEGITSSVAALAVLLKKGVGDTIRVSLTPRPGDPRTQEVEVCQNLLQTLELRSFTPRVISCPGCGRTMSRAYQALAEDVKNFIRKKTKKWNQAYPGVESLTVAVMGCVVNGPGESRHADIGISLPGASEKESAVVYADGQLFKKLKGQNLKKDFLYILERYIEGRWG